MTTATKTRTATTGRSLAPHELFSKLAARVAKNAHLDYEFAERVVDQTFAFLAACSKFRDRELSPSSFVDIGWHTFLLDTVEYRNFCRTRASGRFIDHVPFDDAVEPTGDAAREQLQRTVDTIIEAGFEVDKELWPSAFSATCSQCHAGCSDSP